MESMCFDDRLINMFSRLYNIYISSSKLALICGSPGICLGLKKTHIKILIKLKKKSIRTLNRYDKLIT